jgi:hypothetical protein
MSSCPVCGTPHKACTGATGPLPPVDSPIRSPRKGQTVALHEYNVKAGTRGGSIETTIQLSEEDAKAQGLTAKDRVSAKDVTTDVGMVEFAPKTDADLAPNDGESTIAGVKAAAAPKNKADSSASSK